MQQQENNSDCVVCAQCLPKGNNPAEHVFIFPRMHLAHYLPTRRTLPNFQKKFAEHIPAILQKEVQTRRVSLTVKKIFCVSCKFTVLYLILIIFFINVFFIVLILVSINVF